MNLSALTCTNYRIIVNMDEKHRIFGGHWHFLRIITNIWFYQGLNFLFQAVDIPNDWHIGLYIYIPLILGQSESHIDHFPKLMWKVILWKYSIQKLKTAASVWVCWWVHQIIQDFKAVEHQMKISSGIGISLYSFLACLYSIGIHLDRTKYNTYYKGALSVNFK